MCVGGNVCATHASPLLKFVTKDEVAVEVAAGVLVVGVAAGVAVGVAAGVAVGVAAGVAVGVAVGVAAGVVESVEVCPEPQALIPAKTKIHANRAAVAVALCAIGHLFPLPCESRGTQVPINETRVTSPAFR
jgi:hypothetical protein